LGPLNSDARAAVLQPEDIEPNCLSAVKSREADILLPQSGINLEEKLLVMEKELAKQAIERAGSKAKAAVLLHMNPKTFEKRCREKLNL
jgi:DNA-binding NtrC family response regulator